MLSTYYVSDTVIGTGDIEINKIGKSLFIIKAYPSGRRKAVNNIHIYIFF